MDKELNITNNIMESSELKISKTKMYLEKLEDTDIISAKAEDEKISVQYDEKMHEANSELSSKLVELQNNKAKDIQDAEKDLNEKLNGLSKGSKDIEVSENQEKFISLHREKIAANNVLNNTLYLIQLHKRNSEESLNFYSKQLEDRIDYLNALYNPEIQRLERVITEIQESFKFDLSSCKDKLDLLQKSLASEIKSARAQLDETRAYYKDKMAAVRKDMESIDIELKNELKSEDKTDKDIEELERQRVKNQDDCNKKLEALSLELTKQEENMEEVIANIQFKYNSQIEHWENKLDNVVRELNDKLVNPQKELTANIQSRDAKIRETRDEIQNLKDGYITDIEKFYADEEDAKRIYQETNIDINNRTRELAKSCGLDVDSKIQESYEVFKKLGDKLPTWKKLLDKFELDEQRLINLLGTEKEHLITLDYDGLKEECKKAELLPDALPTCIEKRKNVVIGSLGAGALIWIVLQLMGVGAGILLGLIVALGGSSFVVVKTVQAQKKYARAIVLVGDYTDFDSISVHSTTEALQEKVDWIVSHGKELYEIIYGEDELHKMHEEKLQKIDSEYMKTERDLKSRYDGLIKDLINKKGELIELAYSIEEKEIKTKHDRIIELQGQIKVLTEKLDKEHKNLKDKIESQ